MKPLSFKRSVILLSACISTLISFSQSSVIPYGSVWKYLDNGTNQGTAWRGTSFNDAAWAQGPSELGYGDGDEATVVSFGPSSTNKYITTYFRYTITGLNPSLYSNFTLNVEYDDGMVVYLNGTEIARARMTGTVNFNTLADSPAAEDQISSFTIPASSFLSGTNVIAVEVHQQAANSSDLSFNLQLLGNFISTNLINHTDTWRYLANGSNQGTAWVAPAFNDAGWSTGAGELGYGDGDETTCVSYGGGYGTCPVNPACNPTPAACNNKHITTYFRKTFNITGITNYDGFTFSLMRDDGAVVYINGTEVYRTNMPGGTVSFNTLASSAASDDGNTAQVFTLSRCQSNLAEGSNTIAVEIHQNDVTSSDLSFSLEVAANPAASGTPVLTRNPYLQMGRQTAITIRWRTDIPCIGRVEAGPSFGSYTTATVDESCATTEHEVTLTGLTPDTKYFYRIGTNTPTILQATTSNFFTTLPPANTTRRLRFAVFGDCGRNDNSFQTGSLTQYQRYLQDSSIDAADGMLLLGDNAYTNGTEAEYITGFFNPYGGSILRNHKLYPAPGNHDYYGTSTTSRTGAYYQNFTMPTNGEIGGVASGTEAFYSYDIGDVHFLALDSYGEEAGATKLYDTLGTQVNWIKADLAATNKKWIVAYWHHPPYTKGSHDSDTESDLVAMRENFIRILERNGVDLILCGHSHDYERSYLLKGYYKTNPGDPAVNGVNFNVNTHAVNNSSGKYDGSLNSCTYTTESGKVHHGTVYVVSGSAGANGGVVTTGSDTWPHNAFPYSIDEGGMFYFEVENNRLDAKFINRIAGTGGAAVIGDQFTIMKDVKNRNTQTIVNGNTVTLTASWPGAYSWNPGGTTTRSITVTPPSNATTRYIVSDPAGCVRDTFDITAAGVLPISLLKYDARLIDGKVKVEWTTAAEVNTDFFTVERSSNGRDFTAIGTVEAAGNSASERNYTFVDAQPLAGTSYYRLKQTDLDGKNDLSSIRKIVTTGINGLDVQVLSAGAGKLSFRLTASFEHSLTVKIVDATGRLVWNEAVNLQGGTIQKSVSLIPGVYILECRKSTGEGYAEKVIVQ